MKLSKENATELLKEINFRNGLVVAIAQEKKTGEILMVAFQNREAVMETLTTGRMHYWSRSRKRLWMKGEESGNVQEVVGVKIDCDGDAILYEVRQKGGACHEGYRSCFFRKIKGGKFVVWQKKIFRPEKVYRK
ncbi:MAG: phosphoribosyl-AMP cyclohydrolase [Candidatus Hadarchaeales archaeon]